MLYLPTYSKQEMQIPCTERIQLKETRWRIGQWNDDNPISSRLCCWALRLFDLRRSRRRSCTTETSTTGFSQKHPKRFLWFVKHLPSFVHHPSLLLTNSFYLPTISPYFDLLPLKSPILGPLVYVYDHIPMFTSWLGINVGNEYRNKLQWDDDD